MTAGASAAPGPVSLSATTRYSGGVVRGTASTQVAYPNLAAAYTDVGVTDDADPAPGNLDGAGFSFSAQALDSVGVHPGGSVTSGAATFTWPDVPAGQRDTVTTAGQSVSLTGSGTALNLLTTGTNGTQSGPVTVTYTDGTTSTSTLTVADWYANQAVAALRARGDDAVLEPPRGQHLPARPEGESLRGFRAADGVEAGRVRDAAVEQAAARLRDGVHRVKP